MTFLRRWWPLFGIVGVVVVAQRILFVGYHPRGHASDHLASATVVFPAAALIAIILWSTPSARRQPDVLIASAAWLVAVGTVTVGNLRVVDAIGGGDWSDEQADTLGRGLRGFESGHDLAEIASFVAVGTAVLLAIVLFVRGHVGRGVAIGACVLSVLFPPWLIPGAGVVALAVATCLARRRRLIAIDTAPPQAPS